MRKRGKQKSLRLIRIDGKLNFVHRKKNKKFSRSPDYGNLNWEKVDTLLGKDRDILLMQLEKEKTNSMHTKELLRLLAGGVIIGLSFIMPTLPMVLSPFILNRKDHQFPRFGQTIGRLKRQKLVEIVYEENATLVRITKEGKLRALRYKIYEIKIIPQRKWDRLWRLVIFDIPEKERHLRDIFRQHLKLLRFYQLQKSVWVHAYPCMDEIEFLRQIYHVGFNVTYIVAQQIEDDRILRSYFELES